MTSFVRDPKTLTKDKLKSELSKNRIPLPAKDSRKDVYVELYREHLSPKAKAAPADLNSFSSDEEENFGDNSPRRKRKPGSIGRANMVITQNSIQDVTQLSDDELFNTLKKMGVSVGPIQDTTRAVYQRKLRSLLAGVDQEPDKDVIRQEEEVGDYSDQEEDFSDEEDTQILDEKDIAELERNQLRQRYMYTSAPEHTHTRTTSQRTVNVTSFVNNQGSRSEKTELDRVTRNIDGEEESDEKFTVTKSVNDKTVSSVTNTSSTKKRGMSLWVQVCLLAAVALIVFIIIATMEPSSSNPVQGISNGK